MFGLLSLWACGDQEPQIIVVRTGGDGEVEAPTGPADGGGTADPGSDGPGAAAPVITDVALAERPTRIDTTLTLEPGHRPIERVELAVNGVTYEARFEPAARGDVLEIPLERERVGDCVTGGRLAMTFAAVDDRGAGSDDVEAAITTEAVGTILVDGAQPTDLGRLGGAEALYCGELASTGNDGEWFVGDQDFVRFTVPASRVVSASLDWTTTTDMDLYLLREDGTDLWIEDAGDSADAEGPELATMVADPGRSYLVMIAGWSGEPGAWSLTLE